MTRVRRYYTDGETHNPRDISSSGKLPNVPKSVRRERTFWSQTNGVSRQDGINTISKQAAGEGYRKQVGPRSEDPMMDLQRAEEINEEKVRRRQERERDRRRRYVRKPSEQEEYWRAWEAYTQEDE